MATLPFIADPAQAVAATDLIARFGPGAAAEAAARAGRSRDLGNHIHFCRWRQVGRLVTWLSAVKAPGTIH